MHAVVAVADAIRDRLALGEPRAAAQRFVEFWCGTGAWEAMPAARQDAVATRMGSVLQHSDALFRVPFEGALPDRLPMPMLFLTGARTAAATRRIGELLRALLPVARHETLALMGHMGPITHAAEVNRRIAAFLHVRRFMVRPPVRAAAGAPLREQTPGPVPMLPLP